MVVGVLKHCSRTLAPKSHLVEISVPNIYHILILSCVVSGLQLSPQSLRVRSTHAYIPEMRHQHILPMREQQEASCEDKWIIFWYTSKYHIVLGTREAVCSLRVRTDKLAI